jgi:hypothetical protein
MKQIKILIYISISPYAHIPNIKLSSYALIPLKGYGVDTLVQNKILYPINWELLLL